MLIRLRKHTARPFARIDGIGKIKVNAIEPKFNQNKFKFINNFIDNNSEILGSLIKLRNLTLYLVATTIQLEQDALRR